MQYPLGLKNPQWHYNHVDYKNFEKSEQESLG